MITAPGANNGRLSCSAKSSKSLALEVASGEPMRQAACRDPAVVQPVSHGLLDRVACCTPHARIQLRVLSLELVLDLALGLAADLPADPLAVRVETRRDHPAEATPETTPRQRPEQVLWRALSRDRNSNRPPELQELGGAEGI